MKKGLNGQVQMWQATVGYKRPDNILSSNYTNAKPFTPSYDKDCRPCIEELITNDYARVWWREKDAYSRLLFPSKKDHSGELLRKIVSPNLRGKSWYPEKYRKRAIFIYKPILESVLYAEVREKRKKAEEMEAMKQLTN